MKLVSSADALDFLCKSAPRPWVKRMLRWMIFDGEMSPYFTAGRIVPQAMLASILEAEKIDPGESLEDRDRAIRERWNADFSARMVGKRWSDEIQDDPIEWTPDDEPQAVGAGFFVFADHIDWEAGTLIAEIATPSGDWEHHLFWDADEHLASGFPNASFRAELSGLCFRWDNIEMLQPNSDLHAASQVAPTSTRRKAGRPRKWDWDSALTHMVSVAQHPDGLPTGPGAQARIEELIAEWFLKSAGDSPAPSQIRSYAQRIISSLEKAERQN